MRPNEFIYPEARFSALLSACEHHNFEMVCLLWLVPFFDALSRYLRDKILLRACFAEKLDENLICLIVGNPALFSHHVVVSLFQRVVREGYQEIFEVLLDRYHRFSPEELSHAKEIAHKHKQNGILWQFFEFGY